MTLKPIDRVYGNTNNKYEPNDNMQDRQRNKKLKLTTVYGFDSFLCHILTQFIDIYTEAMVINNEEQDLTR